MSGPIVALAEDTVCDEFKELVKRAVEDAKKALLEKGAEKIPGCIAAG